MNSPKTPKNLNPSHDLASQLKHLGLVLTAQTLDDLLARASTQRWSPRQLLEEVARAETEDLARRSLERRRPRDAAGIPPGRERGRGAPAAERLRAGHPARHAARGRLTLTHYPRSQA